MILEQGRESGQHYTYLYRDHGDERPAADLLVEYIHDDIQEPIRPLSIPVAKRLFVVGDMNIDLAMTDPRHAEEHLQNARDLFTTVARFADKLNPIGYSGSFRDFSGVAVGAHLRQAELSNWARAAKGDNVEPAYFELLTAAVAAARYDRLAPRGRAALIEFMPILLYARALERKLPVSKYGRLALSREERRPNIGGGANGENPNWDCGTSSSPGAADYDKPKTRINTWKGEGRSRRNEDSYLRSGVLPISSEKAGFSDPTTIIFSCIKELGSSSLSHPRWVDRRLPSSDMLDQITYDTHVEITEAAFRAEALQAA